MAKIKINCGGCNKAKCEIKKHFRESALNLRIESTNEPTFELKCPNKISKFNEGDVVKFTIAHGRHTVLKKWECNHEYSCNECSYDNCDDGIVTFRNRAYDGSIEVEGVIIGYKPNLMTYAIAFHRDEFNRIKHLFTENDLPLNHFNAKIDYYLEQKGYVFSWWSKRKFIKDTGLKLLNVDNIQEPFPF